MSNIFKEGFIDSVDNFLDKETLNLVLEKLSNIKWQYNSCTVCKPRWL